MLVKEIYESRREERGESWLIPDNPFKTLENDLKVPTNTPVCRSDNAPVSDTANVLSNESNFSDKDFTVLRSHKTFSSTPIDSEMQEALNIQNGQISDADSDRRRHISKESDDIEVLASNLQGSSSSEQINALSSEDLSDGDFYKSISHYSADDSLSECEDGELILCLFPFNYAESFWN